MSSRATPPPPPPPPSSHRPSRSNPTSPPLSSRPAPAARHGIPRATASAAVSRRTSIKGTGTLSPSPPDSYEALSASLKHETDQKEQLLLQLQNKDQTVIALTTENDNLLSSLSAAEARVNDLYADQARMEDEMAARTEVAEKLRAQVRELEKEKRDLHRRYNEQTSTFEAERQAFYDNEQHLKSRIQSLTNARKQVHHIRAPDSEPEIIPEQPHSPTESPAAAPPPLQPLDDPDSEPAEMTALRLELSTLSTSYSSLQSTLVLLQTQLVDLKRVNVQLQEENESYMILLREKTLSGQFDLVRQVGGVPSSVYGGAEDDEVDITDENDVGSMRSNARSVLDKVEEEEAEDGEDALGRSPDRHRSESPRRSHGRQARRAGSTSHSPTRVPRGESLADLPITGPGLDLAAELGRAENRDNLLGESMDDRSVLDAKGRRKKNSMDARKISTSESHDQLPPSNDMDALRLEVKNLRDANKALSLYASKIIDRIIAEEGFEHVLAADYEKQPKTAAPVTQDSGAAATSTKQRPQSAIFGRSASNPATTTPIESSNATSPSPDTSNTVNTKSQRRSMSFDWRNFNVFGGNEKKADNLRPLTLKPGTTSVTGGRKVETYEDEEDIRERERIRATMKLMGIDVPAQSPASSINSPAPPLQKSFSSPASPPATAQPGQRFSIFRSCSTTGHSETSSINSAVSTQNQAGYGLGISGTGTAELTHEALERAEAENSLAALDAHERNLSDEIAKGGSGGFTELNSMKGSGEEWRSRRSKRSAGGSGSTIWSAGMSKAEDEPDV